MRSAQRAYIHTEQEIEHITPYNIQYKSFDPCNILHNTQITRESMYNAPHFLEWRSDNNFLLLYNLETNEEKNRIQIIFTHNA